MWVDLPPRNYRRWDRPLGNVARTRPALVRERPGFPGGTRGQGRNDEARRPGRLCRVRLPSVGLKGDQRQIAIAHDCLGAGANEPAWRPCGEARDIARLDQRDHLGEFGAESLRRGPQPKLMSDRRIAGRPRGGWGERMEARARDQQAR